MSAAATTEETVTASTPKRSLSDLGIGSRLTGAELAQIGRSIAKTVKGNIEPYFYANKAAIQPLLPKGYAIDRLLKIALGVVRQKPKLQECTVSSLFGAVVKCAIMNLEPDTHNGFCFLIPRFNSVPRKDERGNILKNQDGSWVMDEVWEVNVQISSRGKLELSYRSPHVRAIKAVAAHKNDPSLRILEGTEQKIIHEVSPYGGRGPLVGCYALAQLTSGAVLFEWLDLEEIHRIRDENSDAFNTAKLKISAGEFALESAKSDKDRDKARKAIARASDTPWLTDEAEMGKKTAISRLWKSIPATSAMNDAEAIDGTARDLEAVLDGDVFVVENQDHDEGTAQTSSGESTQQTETDKETKTVEGEVIKSEVVTSGDDTKQVTHEQTIPLTIPSKTDDPSMADIDRGEPRTEQTVQTQKAEPERVEPKHDDPPPPAKEAAAEPEEVFDFGSME